MTVKVLCQCMKLVLQISYSYLLNLHAFLNGSCFIIVDSRYRPEVVTIDRPVRLVKPENVLLPIHVVVRVNV